MMWTYCFLAFIVFLILLIIYLFTHKKTKGTIKAISFCCMGRRHFNNSPFAAACILPMYDNQNESQQQTAIHRILSAYLLQSITVNLIIFFRTLINCFRLLRI